MLNLIAPLLPVITFFVIGIAIGYTWEYRNYADVKAVLESERAQAQANADEARIHAEGVTADVSIAWKRAYDYLSDHPTVRVLPRSDCHQTTIHAGTATLPDGITAPAAIDPAIRLTVEQCEQALNDGIKDAAQLLALQRWIQEVGK